MPNLSRRGLVTSAAALPALAVPAVAAAAVPATAAPALDLPTAIEREIEKCKAQLKELRARVPADPIYAVIERARLTEMIVDGYEEGPPPSSSMVDDLHEAVSQLAHTVPTTPAGLVALASYLHEAQDNMCGAAPYFDDVEDAEAFARSLEAAVRGLLA